MCVCAQVHVCACVRLLSVCVCVCLDPQLCSQCLDASQERFYNADSLVKLADAQLWWITFIYSQHINMTVDNDSLFTPVCECLRESFCICINKTSSTHHPVESQKEVLRQGMERHLLVTVKMFESWQYSQDVVHFLCITKLQHKALLFGGKPPSLPVLVCL